MDQVSAIRSVFENGWNEQDFSAAAEVLADRYVFHVGGTTRTMVLDDLKAFVANWHTGFSDFRFDIHSIVSSGDRAALHAMLDGTHDGLWNGLQPTGNRVHLEHMFFFRFEEDKIVEIWELRDQSQLHQQLSSRQPR